MVGLAARTGRELQRYSPTGCRLVVGCIPYRKREKCTQEANREHGKVPFTGINCLDESIEVLLISSQKGGEEILFPKGGWEEDESKEDAARREAFEEAGVQGTLQEALGEWAFKSKRYGSMYEGFVFPLRVNEQLDLWPEMNVRRRRWVTVAEAKERCQQWWMKEALEKLVVNQPSNINRKSCL